MAHTEEHGSLKALSWGVFLILALSAVFVAAGFPYQPILVLGCVCALAFSVRYIYLALYAGIALAPFIGMRVVIPTGSLSFSGAVNGSIDVSLGEVVLFFVLLAWCCRLLVQWWHRRDQQWRPRLPLIQSYLLLFIAHLASAFSPLQPDPALVVKYSLRPVLFDYLAFIALPVNLLRSRRRYCAALSVLVGVGVLSALDGLVSVFFPANSGAVLGRAYPLPILGVSAIGENYNELAELLVFTVPFTLALAGLVKNPRSKRLLQAAAAFQFFVGLLTFTRTIWIVFACQLAFMALTVWRDALKKYLSTLLVIGVLLLPLGIGMAAYSVSQTAQSSNSTRLMLSEIAFELYQSSPWVGAGAGTFLDRVGSTQVFLIEYGDPLDSHGFIQKLMAETGTFGLIAISIVLIQLGWMLWRARTEIHGEMRTVYVLLISGVGGAFLYQCFNTDYWTAKLWLPFGFLLAGMNLLCAKNE
jgi:hypothetical protein